MSHKETLLSYIKQKSELEECAENLRIPVQYTFKECLRVLHNLNMNKFELEYFKINTVIDYLHDELNTGHWSAVPIETRQMFTVCSFIKAFIIAIKQENKPEKYLKEALKCVDLGLLLGAPLNENSELLLKTATYLTQKINEQSKTIEDATKNVLNKKRKRYNFQLQKNSKEIQTLKCPSIEKFNEFLQQQIPVKLQDCMTHWPAMTKWADINYILSVAGERTVPVEIGSHYADENWGQKLMTVRNFIENHFLKDSKDIGYLAQHNLFDQISELREDIHIPEYCCLSNNYEESCEPDINAWFGPENTVSPLHYDPKDNILAQVFGTKHLILYSPNDSAFLYPHQERLLNNTAQVNPLQPNLSAYPNFSKATMYECYLEAGEMLFIPQKWWHHVKALEKSFSVSFWWK